MASPLTDLPALLVALRSRLAHTLAAERTRWSLWLPVGLGTGVALYFGLPREPAPWLAPAGMALGVLGAASAGVTRPVLLALWLGLTTLAAGLAVAQVRTAWVAAPVLSEAHGPASLSGAVIAQESRGEPRMTLAVESMDGLAADATPERVRVTLDAPPPPAGSRVRVTAELWPPPGPVVPGGYDFQRQAWFDRIGAVGTATAAPTVLDQPPLGWQARLARGRAALRDIIRAELDGPAAAIATALLTGARGDIREATAATLRHAGIAHLLAISGLHVGLVAGLIFGVVRLGVAAVPPLALRVASKKIAAAAALGAAGGYTVFVGAPVPTQRAFLMVAVVLLAITFDREPISMRLAAWAATAILLIRPEVVIGASFQLSFAAVVALIAVYEYVQPYFARLNAATGRMGQAGLYLAGVALSSLVAKAATAPFVLYHFNRIALYAVAANLAAVPLAAFWIMPAGVAVYLLAPLGLAGPAVTVMGWGIELLLTVADTVSAWPGAVMRVEQMALPALIAAALGGLWLTLWQRRWRWLGAPAVGIAVASIAWTPQPDLLLDRDGRRAGLASPDGRLLVAGPARGFVAQIWAERAGDAAPTPLPDSIAVAGPPRLACSPRACIHAAGPGDGSRLAVARDGAMLAQLCREADLVAVLDRPRQPCPGAALWTPARLAKTGAAAIYAGADGITTVTSRQARGDRPWVPPR